MIPHLTFRPQRGTQSQGFQGKHREPRFTVISELESERESEFMQEEITGRQKEEDSKMPV